MQVVMRSVRMTIGLVVLCGCGSPAVVDTELTASAARSARRAFDGAPPVVPHQPFASDCSVCHSKTGKAVPGEGFAPANPHLSSGSERVLENCRQCHVFREPADQFARSDFGGLRQDLRPAARAYFGAPPVIPHALLMRANCSACHAGPAARPEIRCSHPERENCLQCHVRGEATAAAAWPSLTDGA